MLPDLTAPWFARYDLVHRHCCIAIFINVANSRSDLRISHPVALPLRLENLMVTSDMNCIICDKLSASCNEKQSGKR